jgi:auxin influx carrier (AUX1 LAX family)
MVGPRAGLFSQIVVYVALIGLSTVQIISTASNSYILDDNWNKREWSMLWGGLFMFMILIPSFRHYRLMSVLGIVSTTYTGRFIFQAFYNNPVFKDDV